MGWQNLFAWRDDALHADAVAVALPLPPTRLPTHLAWRPEHVAVVGKGQGTLDGRVLARSYLGERLEFLVQTALGPVKGCATLDAPFLEGQDVALQLDPARAAFIG